MKHSSDVMFARLINFQIDIEALQFHFVQHVKKLPPTPYRDNRVDYIGWSVTSRENVCAECWTRPMTGESFSPRLYGMDTRDPDRTDSGHGSSSWR